MDLKCPVLKHASAFTVKNMMLSDKPWSRGHEPRKGNLWIYGDSISYYFYQTVEHKVLCKKIFRKCMVTYNWLYPKTLYDLVSEQKLCSHCYDITTEPRIFLS